MNNKQIKRIKKWAKMYNREPKAAIKMYKTLNAPARGELMGHLVKAI